MQRRQRLDFERIMKKRPTVERKQAHWNAKGGRRSRYMGQSKTRLQAFWSAAVSPLILGVGLGSGSAPTTAMTPAAAA
jgi:hypothetical protein